MSALQVPLTSKIQTKKGYAFKSEWFAESGTPVVKAKDFTANSISIDNCDSVAFDKAKEFERYGLVAGQIIVQTVGSWPSSPASMVGKCIRVPIEAEGALLNQNTVILTPNSELDSNYLYYSLKSENFRSYVANVARGSANQASITLDDIKKFKVYKKSIELQKLIGSKLKSYDDLIENNRRRIALLEESARLLYREWFVHLRFPGHETTKFIDGVPARWSTCTYGDIMKFEGGFAFKSKNYSSDGGYKIVTIKNVHDNRFVSECDSKVLEPPEKMKPHCKLKTGDVLMSLTGNVGRVCIVYGENYLLNQRVAKIRPTQISKEFAYWTFSERSIQKNVENLAHGAAQLNLSPVKLATQAIVLPETKILEMFEKIAKPIFEQIIHLNFANQKLAHARDILLPRLMDGRVEV